MAYYCRRCGSTVAYKCAHNFPKIHGEYGLYYVISID